MSEAVLALGSNLAPRERWLDDGLTALAERGVTVVAASPRWHTRALGGPPQPDYLDLVIRARADLDPPGWLAAARWAEARAGRRRSLRWGPRTLDVDILAVGARSWRTAALELPHPAILARPYLLRGLALVAPRWGHPPTGRTYRALARAQGLAPVRTGAGPPGPG